MSSVPLQVQFDPAAARFGASRSQKRLEDDRLLTGKGRYSDDLELPQQCWLVLVRSPHAHARIRAVDLAAVKSAPGVIAAWTMAELRADCVGHMPFPPLFKRADGSPMAAPPRTPLAEGEVRYVGQPVAAIVAQTRVQAQDAAELAMVEYEDLPCVVDAKSAIAPGAPLVWPQAPDNVAAEAQYGDAAAVQAAMRSAAHVTEIELHNQRVIAMALEPRACTGMHEKGRTTLYTQNQTPTGARELLGAVFRSKPEEFRIVVGNIGAVPVGSSAIIPLQLGPKVQTTVYHVPHVHYRVRAVLTHTMATGAYRGAGRPEANFLMERLIEKAAREMKLDPVEVRRRNFIRPEQFPYRTHVGDTYDVGNFSAVLDRLLAHADWAGFPTRREQAARAGKLRGRGLSVYLEWTGALPTETVDIEVNANGEITVFSGTQAMGQGLETSYTQLVTEVLGVSPDKVKIVQGDTDRANGVGSVGSRSAFVGGSAVVAAGRRVISDGKALAAEALEAAAADIEYHDGRFRIAGTDRTIGLGELAARQERRVVRVSAPRTPSTPSRPNGAQACEVEIDRETGEVRLATIASCDDVGRIINHMIVEGQVHGGVAPGAGQALYERAVYDADSGQLLTGSLMDYAVPRAADLPPMRATFDESVPCKTNLLGVKGCGELGTIGATPAVVHAVLDALGLLELDMPLTSEKVWRGPRGAPPWF